MDTEISFFGENDDSTTTCENCIACVEVCPVSAITFKNKGHQTLPAQE
jgi:ferredoxin